MEGELRRIIGAHTIIPWWLCPRCINHRNYIGTVVMNQVIRSKAQNL